MQKIYELLCSIIHLSWSTWWCSTWQVHPVTTLYIDIIDDCKEMTSSSALPLPSGFALLTWFFTAMGWLTGGCSLNWNGSSSCSLEFITTTIPEEIFSPVSQDTVVNSTKFNMNTVYVVTQFWLPSLYRITRNYCWCMFSWKCLQLRSDHTRPPVILAIVGPVSKNWNFAPCKNFSLWGTCAPIQECRSGSRGTGTCTCKILAQSHTRVFILSIPQFLPSLHSKMVKVGYYYGPCWHYTHVRTFT